MKNVINYEKLIDLTYNGYIDIIHPFLCYIYKNVLYSKNNSKLHLHVLKYENN